MKKNICIIGGGNIGIACAIEISLNKNYTVTLLSSKADKMPNNFKMINTDNQKELISDSINVTNDSKTALKDADIVLVTLPSFLIENIVNIISSFSPEIIFYIPGYGGKELFSKPLVEKNIIIAGLERVPYISRLRDSSTVLVSKKSELSCATLRKCDTELACNYIEDFFNIPCKRVNNYLTISFTPSNPILHTARLYSMFKDFTLKTPIAEQIKFYAEWNNLSSEILIGMDKELEMVCNAFSDIDLSQFKTIRKHYESPDIQSMTNKISNIKAFKNIYSPLIKDEKKQIYYIDSNSRYFQEDFPFGLYNLKGYAEIVNMNTPYMDKVLRWYEKLFNTELFDLNGKIIESINICPQRFSIKTVENVVNFYNI